VASGLQNSIHKEMPSKVAGQSILTKEVVIFAGSQLLLTTLTIDSQVYLIGSNAGILEWTRR